MKSDKNNRKISETVGSLLCFSQKKLLMIGLTSEQTHGKVIQIHRRYLLNFHTEQETADDIKYMKTCEKAFWLH